MTRFTLEMMIRAAGARMRADLSERLTDHPGELGVGREEIIRRFLRAYLPSRFDVSSGFVFDSTGSVSRQIDIVITDRLVCPRFETAGGIKYFPCESVVAVGQIKSALTSAAELLRALENLESVKGLDRSARGKAFDGRRGEPIDHRNDHLHQIFSFLLITGKVLSAGRVQTLVMERILATPAHIWTNIILALDKYLMTFCCDAGICPNPMDARGLAMQPANEDGELLMRFYLLLGQAIEVTRVSALPYWEYLHLAQKWTAEVCYSATGNPPPYLSQITSE
ncbi:MAG: hypothetical protein NTZ56_13295 [Acidobacteria bacterium]|nr:hypothetical protein [Acidobacteriota bacterium]